MLRKFENNSYSLLTDKQMINKKRIRTPSVSEFNSSMINTTDFQTIKKKNKKVISRDVGDNISKNLNQEIFSKKNEE